ncbi:MAG: N-acetylglucosamine-6-phosphate deacetylase [Syntrophorhabdus sp. PtaU1.Bin058]|nr:MAG: N-acetylglucosamine-6-phosphate deacetylase [Syntrophorhabdus sp. PtaU1.Bin058]
MPVRPGKDRKAHASRLTPHGFIDIHTHGIGGYDTRGATPEIVLKIARIHGAHGVSAILPTIYPAPIGEMRADMAAVREAINRQDLQFGVRSSERKYSKLITTNLELAKNPAARILGAHLEGPFLNPAQCGALDKTSFLEPTMKNFKRLIDGFGDIVKIITIAPELKGATRLIKTIADTGIVVSMGHSDATYAEAEAGYRAGAKGITHIFNAMRGIHHREPGIAGFGLLNKEVYIEVITDPFHLGLKTIELIFKVKDFKKIILVSDTVKDTKGISARRGVRDSRGILLGGSMTIPESARRLIGMGFKGKAVMNCITRNPAAYLATQPIAGKVKDNM